MSRYIIADPDTGNGWGHIFGLMEGERSVRFIFDSEENKLVTADIMVRGAFDSASPEQIADLEDSLKNANPGALNDPESYGLIASDDLPEWALPVEAPKP